jgi:hypothetical protein
MNSHIEIKWLPKAIMITQKAPTAGGPDKAPSAVGANRKKTEDDLPDMDTMMNDLGSLVNKHSLGGKTNVFFLILGYTLKGFLDF